MAGHRRFPGLLLIYQRHSQLHGQAIVLAAEDMALHRHIAHANGAGANLEAYDVVIVHDPQPLPLVELRRQQKWIWCCHIDLSAPYPDVWNYLAATLNRYDAAVFSLEEYAQPLSLPQRFIMP